MTTTDSIGLSDQTIIVVYVSAVFWASQHPHMLG